MIKKIVYAAIMVLAGLLVAFMVPVIALEKILGAGVRRLVAVGSLVLSGVCHD